MPKIFQTNTSYEYWSRAASLVTTAPDGERDLPVPEAVRHYFLTGLQHFSGPFPPARNTNPALLARFVQNPLPVNWFWRALFVNLDAWVKDDVEPPASRYPCLADGSLVTLDKVAFPKVPGVTLPENAHRAFRLDFGPAWFDERVITKQPPDVGKAFPVFLPQTDEDGNDRAGVRLPELVLPLATYTGWNLRDPQTGMAGERISFLGAYLPFARTKAEREKTGDPRLSIEERYRSKEDYLERFGAAAAKLAADRFVLREDLPAMQERGAREWDEATGGVTKEP